MFWYIIWRGTRWTRNARLPPIAGRNGSWSVPTSGNSTRRRRSWIYRSSVDKFAGWCRERDMDPLPASPETVAMFLASEANSGMKPATIARHTAAIRYHHIGGGYEDPTRAPIVKSTKKGIRRALGTAPVRKQPEATCSPGCARSRTTQSATASSCSPRSLASSSVCSGTSARTASTHSPDASPS